ncbi:MAG: peptidoglycan editing factor PgeF [Pseudomonadota bacterium]
MNPPDRLSLITPDWRAPARVRACTTSRSGGVSLPPYDGLNLGDHVGDDPAAVAQNRQRLIEHLQLPAQPGWLRQVHGIEVAPLSGALQSPVEADASVTSTPGVVCAVLTADCLPVLFCDRRGTVVAAAHAGWRGLLDGVLEATVRVMGVPSGEILAWFGPAIGPEAFEVGNEVRDAFVADAPEAHAAFRPHVPGKWLADIYLLARQRLNACGVTAVSGGNLCTYRDAARFYSYRRDGRTGRMASLIWLAKD